MTPNLKNQINKVLGEMRRTKERLVKEVESLTKEINLKGKYLQEKQEEIKNTEIIIAKMDNQNKTSNFAEVKKSFNQLKKRATKINKTELKRCKKDTMVETIYSMLQGRELHYKEVIDNLRLIGYPLDAKQPELNIASLLCRDDRFVRVGKGIYTSNENRKDKVV